MGGLEMTQKTQVEIQKGIIKAGTRYGVTLSKDNDGYFVKTNRARSKSYPSKQQIPVSVIKRIESTG